MIRAELLADFPKAAQRSRRHAALGTEAFIMRSTFLLISLALLVCSEFLLTRNVMTKASKMLPMKRGSRATSVRHPSARRKLIRRSRRKSSKTRLQRQTIALARMGQRRDAIVKPVGQRRAANLV
jgi:hypothetical protein